MSGLIGELVDGLARCGLRQREFDASLGELVGGVVAGHGVGGLLDDSGEGCGAGDGIASQQQRAAKHDRNVGLLRRAAGMRSMEAACTASAGLPSSISMIIS